MITFGNIIRKNVWTKFFYFMIEYILRYFDDINKDGKKWFFNCLESILYGIPELPKIKNEYQKESVK